MKETARQLPPFPSHRILLLTNRPHKPRVYTHCNCNVIRQVVGEAGQLCIDKEGKCDGKTAIRSKESYRPKMNDNTFRATSHRKEYPVYTPCVAV